MNEEEKKKIVYFFHRYFIIPVLYLCDEIWYNEVWNNCFPFFAVLGVEL